jgi:hypothetical protein
VRPRRWGLPRRRGLSQTSGSRLPRVPRGSIRHRWASRASEAVRGGDGAGGGDRREGGRSMFGVCHRLTAVRAPPGRGLGRKPQRSHFVRATSDPSLWQVGSMARSRGRGVEGLHGGERVCLGVEGRKAGTWPVGGAPMTSGPARPYPT